MNTKKRLLIIITILLIGLTIIGSTYAFWTWNSNTTKNVIFNTSNTLKHYIIYNEGNSTFSGSFEASNAYTSGMHSTISIYKINEAANTDLTAIIHMNINAIGNNMKESSALKWVVTSGTSNNPGTELANGNFLNVNNGDILTLIPNIEVTTTETFYTIWIWLDSSENPSSSLSGETLDTNVWTEINQSEGTENRFEATQIIATYQTIRSTIINNKYNITSYAVTTTSNEPSTWTSISQNDQDNVYNFSYVTPSTGTYYIWFKDSNNNVIHEMVEVTNIDNTPPVCSWGSFSDGMIGNNETATIKLTCTDSDTNIIGKDLTAVDINVSNNALTISNIAKAAITDGYEYTITVTGTSTYGVVTLTLAAGGITNGIGLGTNSNLVSNSITVANELNFASQTLNSGTYGNSYVSNIYNAPTNGSGNYTYTIKSGAPSGATINSANKIISLTDTTNAGTYNIVVTVTDSSTGLTKDATMTIVINKIACLEPSNIAISTAGIVTWTASNSADSYEISIDNTNFTDATSGINYNSTITASSGIRTVYIRSACSLTNYTSANSSAIDESVTVYSVTLTKGTGVSAVSGSGNYISGSTVTLGATMSANYTWVNWTQSGTINQISATQAYSAAITSNWSYTANATQTFAATICPVGSYVITQGSTCAVCPVGTTSTVTDATSCTTTCSNISNVSSWSVPIGGTLTTYSKTSNFNDDGSVNGTRLSAATDGITDTVTIDGSLALHVSIRYLFDRFTMIKSYCRVCLFMPDTPINNTGYGSMSNECDSSVSGALWANSETTSQYDITGDTAVMYYKCAMSAPDQYGYYGYYAVISGTSVKDNCKINSCETGYLLTENKCLSASPSTASAPNVVAKYVSNDNNYTSGSWTNQEVYLNISSSANDTAITDFQYSLDNGNNWNSLSCTIIQNDTTYSCNKTWDIETYLDNTIIFRGIDSATRLTSNSNTINIKYDQKKPSGGLTVEISEGNNNATISASGNYRDNESGLATTNTYGWSIISENASCNSSVSFVSTTSNTYTFNVTSEGGYQVCLRVLDKVGNANYSSKKIYYTKWRMANGSVQIPDASTCVNRCLEYCQFYLGSTYTIWSCNDETAFLSCDSTSMSHCPTAYDTSGTKCWCRY